MALLFSCLASTGRAKTPDLTFPLHRSDELCVNINNLLSGDQLLNDLSVSQVGDFNYRIPNAIEQIDVPDFVPEEVLPGSLTDLATFGKKIGALAKTRDGKVVAVLFRYDPKTSASEARVFEIAPKDAQCSRLGMDEATFSTVCYSPSESQGFFCSVNYRDNLSYDCSAALNFNLPPAARIGNGVLEMNAFSGRGKNRLFAVFFKSGTGAYDQVKNMFYLRDNERQKFLALEAGATILDISITSYDFSRKQTNLLIFVQEASGRRSLRYYTLENFTVKPQDGNEFERFDVSPTQVYFKDYSLFIVEAPDDQSNLVIRRVNLKERKFPKVHLAGQSSLLRVAGSRHLFLFETADKTTGRPNWFLLDTFCDRFYRFDSVLADVQSLKWSVLQIGYDSFVVVFRERGAVFFKVHSFQSVCATFPAEGFSKGELKISVSGQPVLNANLENHEFEAVLENDFVSRQVALSSDLGSERQFRLTVHGNDLDFGEGSNVYFFHKVSMASSEDRDAPPCVPLRVMVKNRNLVYLCADNRIVLFSSYSLDFHAKTFEFRYKSTYSFPDLSLAEVVELKLYFNQYLALISRDGRFTYIDLTSDAPSLPVFHSDELKQYQRCVFSKHYVLCQKDLYFVVLEITKNNEQVVFSVVNAHLLENTLLESVIVSQYHQDTLYYIRRSFNKDNTFHLIQEIDRVDRKMSRNRLALSGAQTKFFEMNKDEFVIIDWADGLHISGLLGDSLIQFPFKNGALFETVLSVKSIEDAKLFLIFYKTKDGRARLYIGRSSLHVYDRTVRDVEVGPWEEGLTMEAHFIVWSQVLVMVYRKGDPRPADSFVFFLNGPVFFIEKDSQAAEIEFHLNGKHIVRPFAPSVALEPLRVDHKAIHFRDPESEFVVKAIESTKELVVRGGVRDVDATSESEDVKLVPRISLVETKNIKTSKTRGLDTHKAKNLASSFADFSFFWGDLIIKKKEQRANQLYKSCKFIDRGDLGSTSSPRLLCRDKARNDNVITNLVDDPIFLNAPDVKLTAYNLIEVGDSLFFFARALGSKNLHYWRFKKAGSAGFELENHRVVTANDYFLGGASIESFFSTTALLRDKIVLLVHEAFSSKVTVKILGVKSNVFEKYNFEEFSLLAEGKADPLAIYEMKCTESEEPPAEPRVRCLVRSDQFLYDTVVRYEEGRGFSFKIEAQYPFWRNKFLDHNLGLYSSRNFVAIFTKETVGNDVWVYRRDLRESKEVRTVPLFGSFSVSRNQKIVKLSLSDPDEASLKADPSLQSTDSSLWVAVFTDPLNDSDVYRNLNIDQYRLSEFKIHAKGAAEHMDNNIEVSFTDQSNALHTVTLKVVIEHNFVLKVLTWTFVALLAVFVGLAIFVVVALRENKRIKNAMLRQGHNQSMFLDRTMMQI